jgi:hypothetical protein
MNTQPQLNPTADTTEAPAPVEAAPVPESTTGNVEELTQPSASPQGAAQPNLATMAASDQNASVEQSEAKDARVSASPIMKYFEYAHLPQPLQAVSKEFGDLAKWIDMTFPDGAEKSAGLRKLLEAKDCIVRSAL